MVVTKKRQNTTETLKKKKEQLIASNFLSLNRKKIHLLNSEKKNSFAEQR